MKLCVLSDSHDNRSLLATAVTDARTRGAEAILHCGDVVAPTTLRCLPPIGLPLHVIHGNNTGDMYAMHSLTQQFPELIHYHGMDASLVLAGKRIFMVHYPHYARAMALTGEYDLVCCGHDHRILVEPIRHIHDGITYLINPGTVGGVGKPATYILADIATMQFEQIPVSTDHTALKNTDSLTIHH